jgi:hypothetical protein
MLQRSEMAETSPNVSREAARRANVEAAAAKLGAVRIKGRMWMLDDGRKVETQRLVQIAAGNP